MAQKTRVWVNFPDCEEFGDQVEIFDRRMRLAEFLSEIHPFDSETIPAPEWLDTLMGRNELNFEYWEKALQVYSLQNPGLLIKATILASEDSMLINIENYDLVYLYIEYFLNGRYFSMPAPIKWPTWKEGMLDHLEAVDLYYFQNLKEKK